MTKIHLMIFLFFINILLNSGCILQGKKQAPWKLIEPNKAPVVHEVHWKSETLSTIAKWYTGESKNWEFLADANPHVNPDSISLGNRIFIPSHLVKTRAPMTKEFVNSCYKGLNKKKAPAISQKSSGKKISPKKIVDPTPEKIDDFEVIGPK